MASAGLDFWPLTHNGNNKKSATVAQASVLLFMSGPQRYQTVRSQSDQKLPLPSDETMILASHHRTGCEPEKHPARMVLGASGANVEPQSIAL